MASTPASAAWPIPGFPTIRLAELQRRLVLSHAAGTGPLLADDIVRLILILKINALARGFSGIRRSVIEALVKLVNAGVLSSCSLQGLGRRLRRFGAARASFRGC